MKTAFTEAFQPIFNPADYCRSQSNTLLYTGAGSPEGLLT